MTLDCAKSIERTGVFFTTKGLHLRWLDDTRFVVEDVFGNCSLPCKAGDDNEVDSTLLQQFRVRLLNPVDETLSLASFQWQRLEYFYVAHIDYAFVRYLMRSEELEAYWGEKGLMPVGYLDLGNGEGSAEQLQFLEGAVNSAANESKLWFSLERLNIWLIEQELGRICSELMSLLHRAIRSFLELLHIHRTCVAKESGALAVLSSNELVHRSDLSYRAATATTICVISLCTTLDLASKLVHFLEGLDPFVRRYRPAGGKQFNALKSLHCKRLPQAIVQRLIFATSTSSMQELVQLRHDLVHSTSALALEKIYIGYETGEINKMPMFYSYQPWRDCTETGQPVRHLGREYFTGQGRDIEHRLFTWLHETVQIQLEFGAAIHAFLADRTADMPQIPPA